MADVVVNRCNRLGVPMMLAQGVTSDTTNTIVSLNNHVNVSNMFIGLFLVKFPTVVTTNTLPVVFSTIGKANSNVPVYDSAGLAVTAADIVSTKAPTYHLFIYDSSSSRLQLIA